MEILNSRHYGKYAPPEKSIEILDELIDLGFTGPVFCGIDMHNMREIKNVVFEVEMKELNRESIKQKLSSGDFTCKSRLISLRGDEIPGKTREKAFKAINNAYGGGRKIRRWMSRT